MVWRCRCSCIEKEISIKEAEKRILFSFESFCLAEEKNCVLLITVVMNESLKKSAEHKIWVAKKKKSFKVYKDTSQCSPSLWISQSSGCQARERKTKKSGRFQMICRDNGSMKGESFIQCWARANCLSKQINFKCLSLKNPFIYSWPIANTTQQERRGWGAERWILWSVLGCQWH